MKNKNNDATKDAADLAPHARGCKCDACVARRAARTEAPTPPAHDARLVATRVLLDDAHDEATALALTIEEMCAYLADGSPLAALGALDGFERSLEALATTLRGARHLLMARRDGGGR